MGLKRSRGSHFRAIPNATQTIAAATTFTKLNYNTETIDFRGEYDPTTSRFTAGSSGVYHFAASLFTAVTNRIIITLYVNGVEVFRGNDNLDTGSGTTRFLSVPIYLNVGDYVEVYGWSSVAGVALTNSGALMSFQGVKVG